MSNNTDWGPGSYERGLPPSEQYGSFPERERPPEQRSYVPPMTPGGPSYGPFPGGFQAGYGPYPGNGYPAQQVYAAQMPQGGYYAPYDEVDPLPPRPLPLSEAIRQLPGQYWRVLTKPQEATFREEQRKAAWNIVWVQLIAHSVFAALAVLFLYNVSLPSMAFIFGAPFRETTSFFSMISGVVAIAVLLLTSVGFFAAMGIYHLIAKAFKGRGRFLTYSYCYLLFSTPLSLITYTLCIIPLIGPYLTFPFTIYQLVVQIFMTSAVHRLGRGKASLVVLLPLIVIYALYILFIVLLIVLMIGIGFLGISHFAMMFDRALLL